MTDFFNDSCILYNSFQKLFYSFDTLLRRHLINAFFTEVPGQQPYFKNDESGMVFNAPINNYDVNEKINYVLTDNFFHGKEDEKIQQFMRKVVNKYS